MAKRALIFLFVFFLFSGSAFVSPAFAKGYDLVKKIKLTKIISISKTKLIKIISISKAKSTGIIPIFYYSILGQGMFMSYSKNNADGQFCLEDSQIIETDFPVANQSVFLETGEIDLFGNLIYELGVFGLKSKEEAYEVLNRIGRCCEE